MSKRIQWHVVAAKDKGQVVTDVKPAEMPPLASEPASFHDLRARLRNFASRRLALLRYVYRRGALSMSILVSADWERKRR
ncbi:hypothetical protein PATSB16_14110 [Pandoraea thiooxydans]|uniref:Uncharacterized protein n=1 Tax=Pandoraea thiooxydans TaxID=445709 RepID=A0A0G3ESG5_9BURK|nr:hypothetical protein [Pandoraea thiooxydans]AKJ67646.1 hypothetical protein ABW99_04795 [Pandoraea thiooxydans]APR94753.1 hypothetical protein PATSB16_14110 [Pandoraea thiooxydans]